MKVYVFVPKGGKFKISELIVFTKLEDIITYLGGPDLKPGFNYSLAGKYYERIDQQHLGNLTEKQLLSLTYDDGKIKKMRLIK